MSILKDVKKSKNEISLIYAKKGTTIKEFLLEQGINPLLAPMVVIDNTVVKMEHRLEKDATIIVFGPLAGG